MATIRGVMRADPRTKNLVPRLRAGDIAVINHADLDATAARALVDRRVAAVVNAARSISGRYPNGGPSVLMQAGIPLVDAVGEEFFRAAREREGAQATIDGSRVCVRDGPEANGALLTTDGVAAQLEGARRHLGGELDAFARNTLQFLAEERSLLLDPVDVPAVRTQLRGRHALIVVRGEGYKDDLRAIEPYLHDVRPVLVGVDGGADALLEVGLRPDVIIGDMDSVSDGALRCGAELIVHAYARGSGEAPGLARLQQMGLAATVFRAPGTSEDIAMLLADEQGASLVVAVGTHFSLVEFLDKGRDGMASTFLVRLRIGSKLVDAKGIGRLWSERRRPLTPEILLLIGAAMAPLGVLMFNSPVLRTVLSAARLWFRSRW